VRVSLDDTQAFFGPRAAGWEERFGDDQPVYDAAIARLDLPPGAWVADLGCGSGRALVPLRRAVGDRGVVVGVDATPQMLAEARRLGRGNVAALVLGDARRPPLAPSSLDAVVAAGLLPHLDDVPTAVATWAALARPGAPLLVFHPISRAALAARHGHAPSDDTAIAPARLVPTLASASWRVEVVEDEHDRPFVVVARQPS